MKENEDMALLKKHVEQLGEFFDSVQIFVTRDEMVEQNGTINASLGSGNSFTRYGQVRTWLVKCDHVSRIDAEADSQK